MSGIAYMESRGSMTRFCPLTPENVATLSGGAFTYEALAERMAQYKLDIGKIVYDPGREVEYLYYADYELGAYEHLSSLNPKAMAKGNLQRLLYSCHAAKTVLRHGRWDKFYRFMVPVPMLIYDFGRRYKDVPQSEVFAIWHNIYKRIDYDNGMWDQKVLDYVLSKAPPGEKPEPGPDGSVTVYRGMGELSQPPERAISWSTHAGNALWFANHSGRGTHMVVGSIAPADILAYYPGFADENEVIVRPGSVRNIRYEDMFPASQDTWTKLTADVMEEAFYFGRQVPKLGYREESLFSFHGTKHILRVLLLTLVYIHHSGDALSTEDQRILVYFSLLHDIGRDTEEKDDTHGDKSVDLIQRKNLRIAGLPMTKKDYRIAHLIIRLHCLDDAVGVGAIQSEQAFSRRDKERVVHLYRICKDMDGLDRVRFNGLDYRLLRTEFARKLPLFAGCLLKEDLMVLTDLTRFLGKIEGPATTE